ncbi:Heat shock 70 kDa protein [Aureococcus anophagefferens]|nr:Heat shock 70 kDa protein [Aureococcus anophagefferens]
MHVALLVALALPQRTLPLSVGIDLGTSNSCVAWTRADGTRELVPRRDGGGLLTPSVCVVAAPRRALRSAPARRRGRGHHPRVEAGRRPRRRHGQVAPRGRDANTAPPRRRRPATDGWIGAAVPLERRRRRARAACAAAVIASLLDDCEAHCGARPDRAVVGVPACFLPSQREATERAAASCGLSKVQTANEPELAAHAHGVGAGGGDALALVFDLGGGTLDCSLVDVGGETRTMEVVATAGDLNLGGTDFTAALARAENIDEAEAERVKIALTTRKVAATAAGANVTRSRLEACLDPLLERCADAAREAAYLGDARLKGDAELMGSDAGRASTRAKRRKAERADRAAPRI